LRAIEGQTCAESWLDALDYLVGRRWHEQHNLILEVARPTDGSDRDRYISGTVDQFLIDHGSQPLSTVAETIFPGAEYQRSGVNGVYEIYPNEIYPLIKLPREWGRYAYRLVRKRSPDGSELNPLKIAVEKLRSQVQNGHRKRCCYELSLSEGALDLPLYDANDDCRLLYGPCLSHISLKLGRNDDLYLTAQYRSHYYVARALGNLKGLAMLQAFVCEQTGLAPGPLVCVSTFARVDTEFLNLSEVCELVTNLRTALSARNGDAS
jgi:hypothetical protein